MYYFILNADEQIYLRYGGRDAASASTYLDTESFDTALELGLKEHQQYKLGQGSRMLFEKKFIQPKDIASLNENVIKKNNCVECHLIADYQAIELEKRGLLNKIQDMYLSPDIKTIGIELNIPKGLIINSATGAARDLKEGDLITAIDQVSVLTFADLQYQLDKVDRNSKSLIISIERNGVVTDHTITLPSEWWVTDLSHRKWSIEPQLYLEAEPLSQQEKLALQLPTAGFASIITKLGIDHLMYEAHELKVGDMITAVNGIQTNHLTQDLSTHIKLSHRAGDTVQLSIIREGAEMTLPLTTGRLSFRK